MTIGIFGARPAEKGLPHPEGARGFTLLELIVVCTLIGIMLSFSVPSLRMALFSDPLKSTARNLIGLTNGVRQLAIRQQQPYLLHIDESEKRIWFDQEVKSETKETQELKTPREKQLRLPETVSITGIWVAEDRRTQDQTELWISKQGYMERTRIGLEDDQGNRLVVQFYPFLDAATVDEDAQ
ncbi:MAG: hypothetical protein ACD_75C01178G0002 [uncultured bacterium]|nr:MAG: hypothetical protein ACD_75C01178G0002 [uncultured bacterium]HBG21129.1 hypothetical protein [Desulfobulbaceae bacterium]